MQLLGSAIVTYAAYVFLQNNPEIRNRIPGLAQSFHSRVSVGTLSFESPCRLSPYKPSPDKNEGLFVQNEYLRGDTLGCQILVHHVELKNGRDAYTLSREADAKIDEIESANGPIQAVRQSPLIVAGTRTEHLTGTATRGSATFTINRFTIPRNRDVWVIVFVSGDPSDHFGIMKGVMSSIRFQP